jgi:hypothetical protein
MCVRAVFFVGFVSLCAPCGAQLVFVERGAEAGCTHSHQTQRQVADIEFMAAGGAVGDFNRDGFQDLFVIGGSAGFDRLYLNDGQGNFVDVSVAAGVSRRHRGTGAAVGDYNNDGWQDIYVTSIGTDTTEAPGHNILYRNNGDGTFTDVAQAAGVRFNNFIVGDAFGASFGDADGDGDLDLVVAGWYGGNRYFRNNGNGTFTDRTAFVLPLDMNTVRGFAPRFVDMNGDGHRDLLWVGDFFTSRYLVNNGNGTFSNFTGPSGTGFDSNGMGTAVGDFNSDQRLDWYVTSRINHQQSAGSGNMLYMQTSVPHVFAETSMDAGVNYGLWGWGADAQDFDHNGWTDLIATSGYDGGFENDPTFLFMNTGDGVFVEEGAARGITHRLQGRGLLTADFDNDGDRDIVVFNNRRPLLLYRNDLPDPGATSITLFFDTRFAPGLAPDGFGTHVTLATAQGVQTRVIDGGTNYLAQSELSAHFGLGAADRGDVTVRYADGTSDTFPGVRAGRHTIERLVCRANFRQDGQLNFFDVSDFLGRYNQRHPMGDFNRDGLHNFFDVAEFVAAYNAGCP